jgi:hypothetical protein
MPPRANGRAKSVLGLKHLHGSEERVVKLPGQMRDWKVWCVCGGTHTSCNGGWMKRIEDAAKPIMTPLIQGKETRLQPHEQRIVATWAILKAMVSEYDTLRKDMPAIVHHAQRKYLMRHSLPPKRGWGVWIGDFERKDWIPEWVSRPLLLLPENVAARRSSRKATYFNSNSITQVVGKLLIVVIHSPMPDLVPRWRFITPEGGTLFRIWPSNDISIKWPGKALSDRDADTVADALGAFVHQAALQRAERQAAAGLPFDS